MNRSNIGGTVIGGLNSMMVISSISANRKQAAERQKLAAMQSANALQRDRSQAFNNAFTETGTGREAGKATFYNMTSEQTANISKQAQAMADKMGRKFQENFAQNIKGNTAAEYEMLFGASAASAMKGDLGAATAAGVQEGNTTDRANLTTLGSDVKRYMNVVNAMDGGMGANAAMAQELSRPFGEQAVRSFTEERAPFAFEDEQAPIKSIQQMNAEGITAEDFLNEEEDKK